jgi:transposase
LEIIAGIIDEIGIVEKINEIFLVDSREKVNKGEIVKVIILNEPGSLWRPLYLFPTFFDKKAIEYLLGAGIEGENLNIHKIGRVIDKLYKY